MFYGVNTHPKKFREMDLIKRSSEQRDAEMTTQKLCVRGRVTKWVG